MVLDLTDRIIGTITITMYNTDMEKKIKCCGIKGMEYRSTSILSFKMSVRDLPFRYKLRKKERYR